MQSTSSQTPLTISPDRTGDLRRVIGFWGGTAFVVGVVIGSGIFRKPPTIAGLVPNPLVIMGLWVAFGLIMLAVVDKNRLRP